MARVCSVPCAIADVMAKKQKEFRAETRRRKTAIKTQSEWVAEVQIEFNRYVRARDAGRPCISCGTTQGQVHAGHYKPTGSHPELRFSELNCHAQCATCNNYKSGNLTKYRAGLIARIGLPMVEFLEGPHKPLKLSVDELKALKKHYKEQTKMLKCGVTEAANFRPPNSSSIRGASWS